MIKAVLFDYGGVLTEGGGAASLSEIYGRLYGLKPEVFKSMPLHEEWMCGKLGADEFFAKLNALHPDRPPADKERFLQYSSSVFVRSESVRALAAELRQAGLRTGIISDAVEFISKEHLRRGDYDGFDPLILSWQEGVMKPDERLYTHALDAMRLPAGEVLFIDDQERCLAPAHKLDMYTILAESPEQIVRETKALLETENGLEL